MKISCLMPTYNRCAKEQFLIEESIQSFLFQDYEDCELIICNDTPNQKLNFHHEKVIVQNVPERFETLSDKIQYMIDQSTGDALCRWDDDDISLPHRLSYSAKKLGGRLEWRPENYWYCPKAETHYNEFAGNTHVTSLWRREVLEQFGGSYPEKASGWEDQQFNIQLNESGVNSCGEIIPPEDIFYLYRWGVSHKHLSGTGGGNEGLQNHYDAIGREHVDQGVFVLDPHWSEDYVLRANEACSKLPQLT